MADETIPPPTWTVYRITNLASGKLYFGLTKHGLRHRWAEHIKAAANPLSRNSKLLHKAILKHGVSSFKAEVVACGLSKIDACALEKTLIATFGSLAPSGYNATAGGEDGTLAPEVIARIAASNRGRKYSAETRRKIGLISSNRSPETRQKLSAAAKNRAPISDATRAKLSEASRGRKMSEDFKRQQSARRKGKPSKPVTSEHAQKISAALRGKPKPDGFGAKISAARKGMVFSDSHRANISQAARGRVTSDQTKEKLSHALRGRRHTPEAIERMRIAAQKRCAAVKGAAVARQHSPGLP